MMTWRSDTERERDDACAAFEAVLPDYLDAALAPDAADVAAAHIAGCSVCRELVRDLQAIRTQAAALPALQASRDLWGGVEARLAPRATVTDRQALAGAGRGTARQTALRRWFGPHYATRVAALAAGLVISTAALTYLATRALVSTHAPPRATAVATVPTIPATVGQPTPNSNPSPTMVPPLRVAPSGSAQFAARTSEYLYDTQIASLHKILEQRRGQLDPKTIAVIERSLRVIDTAIAQSKAALARDPANGFLAGQLDRDLDTKLELLRTVALLPSHT
jgi:hypothetical protein